MALIMDYCLLIFLIFVHFYVTDHNKPSTAVMTDNTTDVPDGDLPSNKLLSRVVFIILLM